MKELLRNILERQIPYGGDDTCTEGDAGKTMIPVDIERVREIVNSGPVMSRGDIIMQVYTLRSEMPYVPKETVGSVLEEIILQEQARLFISYEKCFAAIKSDSDMECLSEALSDDVKESCEEFVEILTS